MTDRFNQPAEGADNWDVPLNENFADLGVEVADEVATWGDLPAADGTTSSNGNPKVYRVAADDVFVRDTGSSWEIVAGLGSSDNPLPAVHTERASIDSGFQGPAVSPWANRRLQGQKRVPLPSFDLDGDNPKLTAADIDWTAASVGDPSELFWPSPITTDQLPNPEAANYCYFSSHDTDGIGVAWFDDPFGSWTPKGSPAVDGTFGETTAFVDKDTGDVTLYSCRPNDEMNRLTSPNGVDSFTDQGVVFSASGFTNDSLTGHVGYPRAVQGPDGTVFISSFWKATKDCVQQGMHISPDGESNWTHLAMNTLNRQAPTGSQGAGHLHHSLTPWPPLNCYLAFYTEVKPDGTEQIRMGLTENGVIIRDVGVAIDGSEQAWMNNIASSPATFWHAGNLYIAFSGGGVGNDKIGIARADFSEVKA